MKTKSRNRDGVFIRRGGYYISFTDAKGRRKQRKLKGVISLTEAKRLRNEELAKAERARVLGYVEPTEDTFAEFAPEYLKHQEKTIEPSSYQRTKGIVDVHLMQAFGEMRLASIRRVDAMDYIDSRLEDVSKDTVVKEVNVLKGLLTWAVEKEKIAFNPLQRFGKKNGMPRESEGRAQYIDGPQLVAVLDQCPLWLRAIVALLVATGMRRSEVIGLRWHQIRTNERQIFLPKTKTHKERYVKLNDLALKVLERFTRGKPSDYLVPQDITPNNVSIAFKRACDRAGIVDFRLHDLRHTCASWMRMQGCDLQDVAKQLGHANIRTSDRYAHLGTDHMLTAIRKVDEVFGGAMAFFEKPTPPETGHDVVTIEMGNRGKQGPLMAIVKQPSNPRQSLLSATSGN